MTPQQLFEEERFKTRARQTIERMRAQRFWCPKCLDLCPVLILGECVECHKRQAGGQGEE